MILRIGKQYLGTEFGRFLMVGALNAAFGYGLMALLLYCGLGDALALLGATIAGVLFNFKTTGVLVFRSHDNKLILRFILTYAIVYGINLMLLKGLEFVGIGHYYGFAVLLLPMAVLAYILNRKFVFAAPA